MKPNILSWNLRGLNDEEKCLRIKNLQRVWKVDVLCPKWRLCPIILCVVYKLYRGCNHVDWCCLDSRGCTVVSCSCGIGRWWRKIIGCVVEFLVTVSFRNVEDQFAWAFAYVYGPNADGDRRFLWDELSGLLSWWDLPYCIEGDFNVTRFPSERSGEARICPAMLEFSDFISKPGLMDIPLVGMLFYVV
jgi:hypothetical protein